MSVNPLDSDRYFHTDKYIKRSDSPIYILRCHWLEFPNVVLCDVFCPYLSKSSDPDEMLHSAIFHLGLHCLLKYLFKGIQYKKG